MKVRRIRSGAWASVLLITTGLGLIGCTDGFFVEPAGQATTLRVSYVPAPGFAMVSAASAFDKADHIHVLAPTLGVDEVMEFEPAAEVRVRVEIDPPETATTHAVQVELLRNNDVLFRGVTSVSVEEGESPSVEVPLAPVVTAQVSALPVFTAIGDTFTIRRALVFATGDTLPGGSFTFASSNISVATVNANGQVRAIAEGNAQITMTEGGKPLTSTALSVAPEIATITLAKSVDTLTVGQQRSYTAIVRDRNGNQLNRQVAWFIQDTLIAKNVGGVFSGAIIGHQVGTTVVRATTVATATTPSMLAQFTLVVRPAVNPACTPTPITLGQTVSGTIDATSCLVGTRRVARYTLNLAAETEFNLTRIDGQPWTLFMALATCCATGFSTPGSNPFHMRAGQYLIELDAQTATATGSFSFSTSPTTRVTCWMGITKNVTINSVANVSHCGYRAPGSPTNDPTKVQDEFRIIVANGETINLAGTSAGAFHIEVRPESGLIAAQSSSSTTPSTSWTNTTGGVQFVSIHVVGPAGGPSGTLGAYTLTVN